MLGYKGRKTDFANMPLGVMARGNSLDSYFTLKIFKKLSKRIEDLKMDKVYYKLISPAIHLFSSMEMDGLLISRDRLEVLGKKLSEVVMEKEDILFTYKEVPKVDIKITSTQDLARILYSCDPDGNILEGVGFGLFPPKTTEAGAPSTDAQTLEILKELLVEEINRRNAS